MLDFESDFVGCLAEGDQIMKRKVSIYFVLHSTFRIFGYAEVTHARKNSNNNLVFPSLNRTFAP